MSSKAEQKKIYVYMEMELIVVIKTSIMITTLYSYTL